MSYDLQVLAKNRDALLLAEVAAWLHDWQKVIGLWEQLGGDVDPSAIASILADLCPSDPLQIGTNVSVKEIVEQGKDPSKARRSPDWRIRLMGVCHGIAHVDKPEEEGLGSNCHELATVFGYECYPQPSFGQLRKAVQYIVGNLRRKKFLHHLQEPFTNAVGDSRRPINEVTLWSWGASVAAFYKAAAARFVLEGKLTEGDDLKWRILRVVVDGLGFYSQTIRLPDLMARRDTLNVALDQVRILLEETYPVGNEVYSDETGIAFLVPDLEGDNRDGTLLKGLLEAKIQPAFNRSTVAGEIAPRITISRADAHGSKLADELARPVPEPQADPQQVAQWWQNEATDICPVCGLRPQAAPNTKAGRRKVCTVCERRRADRAQAWAGDLSTTIWTDEVADTNGRLALIVGQFDLTHWLDGTMVKTLLVTDPQSSNAVSKNPSFARIRRVWETTRTFWQAVLPIGKEADVCQSLVAGKVGIALPRLEIRGTLKSKDAKDKDRLGPFHTYELVWGRNRLSVVWDSDNHRFITCDNLDYLAKPEQIGRPVQEAITTGQTISIEEPVGYGGKNKVWGEITITDAQSLSGEYTPAIPILAEPRTFMALVPADRALEAIKAIKAKYEREMGKVRNRLPLTLGAVYFGRRTPLAAALDAGRRMLRVGKSATGQGQVLNVTPKDVSDDWPKTVAVTLKIGTRQVQVKVQTVMGDGITHDVWYPYWRVEGNPAGRERQFIGTDGAQWVHVCDLRPRDQVYFTPSTFDFEYLDTTARRFEVSYAGGQRRGADKRQRPYLLGELDQIEQVWVAIQALATSQLKALAALIETKRQKWQQPTGDAALALPDADPFRQLCRDALATAGWCGQRWKDFSDAEKNLLERAALSGMLNDTLELHLTIAKEGAGMPVHGHPHS